jgi:membrane peptidoglycan carboxypeptidase
VIELSSSPRPRKWLARFIWLAVLVVAVGVAGFALVLARTDVPSPNEVSTSEATIVYYADGQREIGRLGEATRRSVELANIPEPVQLAVLSAEDRDFYNHGGISPVGIARSAWNNITGGSTQGASTITQQYAKNAFLTQERSWDRKIKEAMLAFKLETIVSKDQILEDYLNTIYFGRGAYGIEAASIAYFNQPVAEINVSQAAMLAAIIKSPGGLAPEDNLPGLKGRWEYVLDSMVEQGWLDPATREEARFPEIKEQRAGNRLGGQTGYLLTAVEKQLREMGYDETEIQRGGLKIVSTFERRAQRAAVAAVKEQGPSSNTEGLRLGLAAVRPGTGEVVAMYGGKDFIDDQINNATRAFAQAGSTFKAFALAAATEKDLPLNSVWMGDSPATINGYTLRNYGNRSFGIVTLLQATEYSINTAYVEMEAEIGVDAVADVAIRAGIPATTPGMNLDALDLTFVLGTASPSALDMANSYATFASRGTRAMVTFVKSVTGPNGGLLFQHEPDVSAEFDSMTADTVTYALNRVVTNGTGTRALELQRPAAAKTGTTDDNKSAWFAGYTPQLSTAVMMAKEDSNGMPTSMAGTGGLETVTGGSFPAAIWTAFMKAALKGEPVVEFPPPPAGAMVELDCPEFLEPGMEEVPMGCPVPDVTTEFEPEPIEEEFAPTDINPEAPLGEVPGAEVLPGQELPDPAQGDLFGPDNDGRTNAPLEESRPN